MNDKGLLGRRERCEKGSAVLEMAVILPLAALLLSAAITLGPYIHIGIATQEAAYDCAVAAAQSLDSTQGYLQGMTAAQDSFTSFRLNPSFAQYSLSGSWERGGMVSCTVGYQVPVDASPLRMVAAMPRVVRSSVHLPVQVFKSQWK